VNVASTLDRELGGENDNDGDSKEISCSVHGKLVVNSTSEGFNKRIHCSIVLADKKPSPRFPSQ
jgi:hypothetical protein